MSWTGDKPESFTCKDNSVEYTGPEPNQSIIFNAMYSETTGEGETYFEFNIEKGQGVSIGLTTKDAFKPGYKLRGACYNGNLTNASGSKHTGFGPATSSGDVVGVLAIVKNSKVAITFYINGSCLGEAFNLAAPDTKLHPVVSLRQPGDKVSITKKPAPSTRSRNEAPGPFPEGSWQLEKFGGDALGFDANVTFQSQGNSMGMTAKIINTLRTSLEHQGGDEYKPRGRVVSTMMAGPEPQLTFETKFTEFMENLTTISKSGDGCVIKSDQVEAQLERKSFSFEPITEGIFL